MPIWSKDYLKLQSNYNARMEIKFLSIVIFFALILLLVIGGTTKSSAVSLVSPNAISTTASGTLHNQTLEEIVKPATLEHDPEIDIGINPVHMAIYSEHLTGIAAGTNLSPKMYVATPSDFITVVSVQDNTKIKDIKVGRSPSFIEIPEFTGLVYVANKFDGNISVISVENNTKIKDIPVGKGPSFIMVNVEVNGSKEIAYVANNFNDSISVISVENNTKIKDIPVGKGPGFIANYGDATIYVANTGSNTVSVISALNHTKIKDIPVGKGPSDINIPLPIYDYKSNSFTNIDKAYVANIDSNTVSVISALNNTKIKDIPVGKGPSDIASFSDKIYVANIDSNTVSVISTLNNTKIKDIPVGKGPSDIASFSDKIYVANIDSNTVSVISALNNTKIKDIPVGKGPSFMSNYIEGATIYVANSYSDGLSIIDGVTDKVVAKITFNINPANSGSVICNNNLNSPLNQSFYILSGTECVASPNKGFGFLSWVENFNSNSSITIKKPTYHNYFLDSVLDLFGVKPNDPAETLNVTQFGNFTANFETLPPPLPPEYWGTIFTVVATALVGTWLLPSAISWTKSKMQHRNLRQYRKRINLLKNSKSDCLIEQDTADKLKNEITTAYSRGKINELQYKIAQEEILQYYQDDVSKAIDLLKNVSGRNNEEYTQALDKARDQLTEIYSQGKIDNEHYVNLMNKISVLYEEMYDRRINSLYGNSHDDKIRTDLTKAYAKGMISELHYNLLSRRLIEYEKDAFDDSRGS